MRKTCGKYTHRKRNRDLGGKKKTWGKKGKGLGENRERFVGNTLRDTWGKRAREIWGSIRRDLGEIERRTWGK